jgi:hypothetical protein
MCECVSTELDLDQCRPTDSHVCPLTCSYVGQGSPGLRALLHRTLITSLAYGLAPLSPDMHMHAQIAACRVMPSAHADMLNMFAMMQTFHHRTSQWWTCPKTSSRGNCRPAGSSPPPRFRS